MDEVQLLNNIGIRVRSARLALGLSQEKMALDCGLDRTYVSSVERGKRNVSLVNIHRLASALGVTASDLLLENGGTK